MKAFHLSLNRVATLAVAALTGLSGAAVAGPGRGADASSFPAVSLPGVGRGAAAVDALGRDLPAVAAAYGYGAAQLRLMLLSDGDLAVDQAGRLLFTDGAPDFAPLPDGTAPAAVIPTTSAFSLHSRPGASRTVYLDFNGHTMSGNGWTANYNGGADIVAPPFDTDGNPLNFSDGERNVVIEVWQRVAEDFAPFDVDVTTELGSEAVLTRSSSTDAAYGTRVLISPISQYWGAYGGIAYVGVFDSIGDYYKPALVFPERLGWSAKNIAEAASHEAGHNLGLRHDGTATSGYYAGQGSGETGWAPIMGVGYYQNLSQWSRGEYSGANNTEDDLQVMGVYGLPSRNDDHGDSAVSASPLTVETGLSGSGIIESADDVDVHSFSLAGTASVTLDVVPAAVGPNLDIVAELRDSNGTLLGTANPATSLGAAFAGTLSAGTYYLSVGGAGLGDPLGTGYSDYGSLGQYSVLGTISGGTPNLSPTASISATPTSGTAPVVVSFSASGSSDPDGSIVSYSWNFGDGTGGSGVSVDKTYASAGNYVAVLTVTDNLGATATATKTISVAAPPMAIKVKSIALSKKLSKGKYTATAVVTVVDQSGAPVGGVTVVGAFSGAVSGSKSALTSSSGKSKGRATLTSPSFTTNGGVTFTVTGLSKSGFTYSSADNLVASVSIP